MHLQIGLEHDHQHPQQFQTLVQEDVPSVVLPTGNLNASSCSCRTLLGNVALAPYSRRYARDVGDDESL